MKFKKVVIHPSFMLLVLYYILTQQLFLYSMLLISLLVHELGHVITAKLVGVRYRQLTVFPFGGQLQFMPTTTGRLLLITIGGPFATCLLCIFAYIMQWQTLMIFQLLLLVFNCLPVWPLDGGKIVYYTLQWQRRRTFYKAFMSYSFGAAIVVFVIAVLLEAPLFLLLSFSLLVVETYRGFQFRHFTSALEQHKIM
jgi:stage IV sporulation protein FB